MLENFGAILLCGGKSSRMGQDKALLRYQASAYCWQGIAPTLLEHQQLVLIQTGASEILLSGNRAGAIADHWPDKGPLAGIHACLSQSKHQLNLVIPVDMPGLSPRLLETLVQRHQGDVSTFTESTLPCVLRRSEALLDYLELQLQQGGSQCSLRQLQQQWQVHQTPCPAPEQLFNLNTITEWRQHQRVRENLWPFSSAAY
jgi:molybdopterin-guanine dinucleotide biosynthesis protein A